MILFISHHWALSNLAFKKFPQHPSVSRFWGRDQWHWQQWRTFTISMWTSCAGKHLKSMHCADHHTCSYQLWFFFFSCGVTVSDSQATETARNVNPITDAMHIDTDAAHINTDATCIDNAVVSAMNQSSPYLSQSSQMACMPIVCSFYERMLWKPAKLVSCPPFTTGGY